MGTTGTIMGCSRFLKEKNPAIQVIGVQPREGASVPGIRKWPEAYLPKIFDRSRIDRVIEVSQEESEEMTRRLAREEGIFAGISAGGGLAAAMNVCARGAGRRDRHDRPRPRRSLPLDRRLSRLMTPILVFDIETVPDAEGLRKLWELEPCGERRRRGRPRFPAPPPGHGQRFPSRAPCSGSSRSRARCAATRACASGRWAPRATRERRS